MVTELGVTLWPLEFRLRVHKRAKLFKTRGCLMTLSRTTHSLTLSHQLSGIQCLQIQRVVVMRIWLSPGWRILKPSVFTSSYEEEKIAIDNELLLKALLSGSDDISDARCMLYKYAGKTNLSWIPGHHGVACVFVKHAPRVRHIIGATKESL